MSRPKRIPGYSYVGVQRYFVTACTLDRAEYFRNAWAAAMLIDVLLRQAKDDGMEVVTYCVMPDHMHLLLDGEHDGADFVHYMNLVKQRSGFHFKQRFNRKLWQEGYYEHVLRDEEKLHTIGVR